MPLTEHILQPIKTIILTVILAVGISLAHAAWTGPTQSPPEGNTPPPVNVGTTDQVKDAGLGVDVLAVYGNASVDGYLQIGDSVALCDATIEGALRYEQTAQCLQLCVSTNWQDVSCAAPPVSCVSGSQTFSSPGTFTLPVTDTMAVCNFTITLKGAGGGWSNSTSGAPIGIGASGGGTQFNFIPGSTGDLSILVGGAGVTGSTGGGYGGGGAGGTNSGQGQFCSGGGGASAITFESIVLGIAGGGGGISVQSGDNVTGVGGSGNNKGGDGPPQPPGGGPHVGGKGGGNNSGGVGGRTLNGGIGGAGGSNGAVGGNGAVGNGGTPGNGGTGFSQFLVSGGGGGGSSGTSGCGGGGGGGGYGGGGGGFGGGGGGGYANLAEVSTVTTVAGSSGAQNGSVVISWE